jgi:hypothetical protein
MGNKVENNLDFSYLGMSCRNKVQVYLSQDVWIGSTEKLVQKVFRFISNVTEAAKLY